MIAEQKIIKFCYCTRYCPPFIKLERLGVNTENLFMSIRGIEPRSRSPVIATLTVRLIAHVNVELYALQRVSYASL